MLIYEYTTVRDAVTHTAQVDDGYNGSTVTVGLAIVGDELWEVTNRFCFRSPVDSMNDRRFRNLRPWPDAEVKVAGQGLCVVSIGGTYSRGRISNRGGRWMAYDFNRPDHVVDVTDVFHTEHLTRTLARELPELFETC